MKSRKIIDLNSYINSDLVWKYFSAFQKRKNSLDGIEESLKDLNKNIASQVNVKALLLTKEIEVKEGCIEIAKRSIDLNIGAYPKAVRMYMYAIDLNGLPKVDDVVVTSFLDLFGTAYMNLSIDILKEIICEEEKYVSYPFGPGLFNMEVRDFEKELQDSNLEDIGVNIKDGAIYPSKACVGFYIASDDRIMFNEGDCSTCMGNSIGCSLCKKYLRGENE